MVKVSPDLDKLISTRVSALLATTPPLTSEQRARVVEMLCSPTYPRTRARTALRPPTAA